MLNMIAGSVLPITAFIGVFFAFAATCILTSFLNDWLPRDMGREFAHNGKLSAGKPRGAGIDRKSTRLNSSHKVQSRMPSSA